MKGVRLTLVIPDFDIIRSFSPENMHCILLGIVKLFLAAWFESQFSGEAFYIGNKKNICDEKMLKISPPCEVTRTPQTIENVGKWKASECRHFLMYYSPFVLKDILPNRYFKHWYLLVYAVTMFNKDKISEQDYQTGKRALLLFVQQTQTLYGIEMMKYNVHLLTHIPRSVRDFGALRGWSAFPYESYNRVLRQMLRSSQAILQQICKSYLRMKLMSNTDVFKYEDCKCRC